LQVVFVDENGYTITLDIDENGAVDYSYLEGAYTVKILSDNDEVLSEFELSVEQDDEPTPPDDEDEPKKSPLPTILMCILLLLAAGGAAAYFLKKKKTKKSNK